MKKKLHPTIIDVARNAGLEVEKLDGMPTTMDGYLDTHETSRFIAVNQSLPSHEQTFTIAREIGYFAQEKRWPSLILNRPWKWNVLAAAPEEIRERILQLEAEVRGYWLMISYANRDEFRMFFTSNPKRLLRIFFADALVHFHLAKIPVQTWLFKLFYALALS